MRLFHFSKRIKKRDEESRCLFFSSPGYAAFPLAWRFVGTRRAFKLANSAFVGDFHKTERFSACVLFIYLRRWKKHRAAAAPYRSKNRARIKTCLERVPCLEFITAPSCASVYAFVGYFAFEHSVSVILLFYGVFEITLRYAIQFDAGIRNAKMREMESKSYIVL